MIGKDHPLFSVDGVFNAILVNGNVLGDVMFYGSGAGKLPTASAVVSDIVDAVRNLNNTAYVDWSTEKLELADIKESEKKFFVRVSGDKASKEAEINKSFGNVEYVVADDVNGEFAFVTDAMKEKDFEEAASSIDGMITRIRME